MKTNKWIVCGWNDGDTHQAKAPDCQVEVTAKDEAEAEDKGERKINKKIGRCELIMAFPKPKP